MIGAGLSRTDGPMKVSGRAAYTLDRTGPGEALHGFVRDAAIGRGRITHIDTAAAEAAPGVELVMTHRNAPKQPRRLDKVDLFDEHPQLDSDRVEFFGEPVALVVAKTFEQARAAAGMIEVAYEVDPDSAFALEPSDGGSGWHERASVGDLEAAMKTGDAAIEVTYSTPYHFSQPMELNAAVAEWRDGHLTLYLAGQMLNPLREGLAKTLMVGEDQITVDSAFVGGGFGSKIALHAEAVLASLAARELNQPVKVMMTRRQIFTLVGHRPATLSRIRLAATPDGKLTGIGHDTTIQVTRREKWNENAAMVGRPLYAAPNRLMRTAFDILDTGAPEPVRGPGEVPGLLVLESAIDEMAEKIGMDPVAFRLANDMLIDPHKKVPLSGRRLAECLTDGAARFGWADRPKKPASRREGNWLVGYGVGSSVRGHSQTKAKAKVRIEPDGRVVVSTDMTDLGTGTYTIAAQVAASALGVPIESITVKLARTDLPKGMGSGGSWGSGNTSVSIDRACQALREEIGAVAGASYNDILAEVRRHFPEGIEAIGATRSADDEPDYKNFSLFTYGATFAEVAVDASTAEVRVRRMLGVFSCGRILNPKTARSQMLGGMIWGVGAALHEGAYVDPRNGVWVNGDLAEYLIPTHADIPAIEAILLDDFDEHANHLGVKGIGELGAGGTAGAVANAVFNATGVRVRDFPITIAKLLPGMPDA